MNDTYLMLVICGFAFGWATNNLVYGRKGCDHCFVALIRGKKCSDCEGNVFPKDVKTP